MSLREYGWNDFFARAFEDVRAPGIEPGRVVMTSAGPYGVRVEDGEVAGIVAGRLQHAATSAAELPTVGDWVAIRRVDDTDGRIEAVLPRRTRLSRKASGRKHEEQVVAANIDTVVSVMGLDGDFNLRRIERILATVWQSGARPVVLLNKLDLADDPEARRDEVVAVAPDVPVLLACCLDDRGVDAVREMIRPRETAVLLGSSGAGKSTLINRLLGEALQPTGDVRDGDDRGRHTTTHRELFRLPCGGMIIDNPGIREIQLWGGEASLERAFDDVAELADDCRFRDCTHESEPGCAVRAAVESGTLEPSRLESFRNLQKELQYLDMKQNETAQRIEKAKWRNIQREYRKSGKYRRSR